MELNLSPVKVRVNIEQYIVKSEAFYNVCFITENDLAPRTIEVKTLNDLLKNKYYRFSLAYDFCRMVLLQQGVSSVFIRAKRSSETYEEAFNADDNSNYYYVVIDTKDINKILSFNTHINLVDSYKLQFFSSNADQSEKIKDRKIVFYYNPYIKKSLKAYYAFDDNSIVDWDDEYNLLLEYEPRDDYYYLSNSYGYNDTMLHLTDGTKGYWDWWDDSNNQFDDGSNVLLQAHDLSSYEAQTLKTAYPEGGWIGLCGSRFPSKVQWLHKFIAGVDDFRLTTIPNLSTTSIKILNKRSTEGSGVTGQGIVINEQVSLDWVRYAISKNVWNLLYNSDKVNATSRGVSLVENKIKEVLDIAVREDIFSEYKITQHHLDKRHNNLSFKFKAKLTYSILNANIEGTVYN